MSRDVSDEVRYTRTQQDLVIDNYITAWLNLPLQEREAAPYQIKGLRNQERPLEIQDKNGTLVAPLDILSIEEGTRMYPKKVHIITLRWIRSVKDLLEMQRLTNKWELLYPVEETSKIG